MIAIGSDHGGYKLKEQVKKYLEEKNIKYKDFGTYSEERMDFPDIAKLVCNSIQNKKAKKGILICTSGVGMSIAANKFEGIFAVNAYNENIAKMSRLHNNTNVITFGQEYVKSDDVFKILNVWLNSEFLGDRYQKRIDKISGI